MKKHSSIKNLFIKKNFFLAKTKRILPTKLFSHRHFFHQKLFSKNKNKKHQKTLFTKKHIFHIKTHKKITRKITNFFFTIKKIPPNYFKQTVFNNKTLNVTKFNSNCDRTQKRKVCQFKNSIRTKLKL